MSTVLPADFAWALIVTPNFVSDENVPPTGLMTELGTRKVIVFGLPLPPAIVPSIVFDTMPPTYRLSLEPLPPLKAVTGRLMLTVPSMPAALPLPTCEPLGHAVGPMTSSRFLLQLLNA